MKKIALLILAIGFGFNGFSQAVVTTTAETHYVVKRPLIPEITKVVAPGPEYVWVDEDWKYNPASQTYEWVGAHWVQPPATGQKWIKGKWKKDKKGFTWESGYWK